MSTDKKRFLRGSGKSSGRKLHPTRALDTSNQVGESTRQVAQARAQEFSMAKEDLSDVDSTPNDTH